MEGDDDMTRPERIRDATVQRLADWCDATVGVGCFGLARRLLTTCAATATGTGLVLHGLERSLAATTGLYDSLLVSLSLLAASGYLRAVEGRMTSPRTPGVIPLLRHWLPVTLGLGLLGASTCCMGPLTLLCVDLVRAGRLDADAGWTTIVCAMTMVTLTYPLGILLACCEWRRRPRVRREAPASLALGRG